MRSHFILLLGAIQVGVGVFIALRPLTGSGAPITNSRVLDMAFAAFFLIRGAMHLRNARRASREASQAVAEPPTPPDS